jgi:hypothetical protein
VSSGSALVPRVPPDLRRLARVLGMTGSAHDGEALNAARLADKLVRGQGMTWDVVLGLVSPSTTSLQPDLLACWPARWRGAVQLCLRHSAALGDRERSFVQSLAAYQHKPSPKQLDWLRPITERVIGVGGGR